MTKRDKWTAFTLAAVTLAMKMTNYTVKGPAG